MNEVKIPQHIGLIMDGNRRWAKEQGKKSIDGHLAGSKRIISLAPYIFEKGVKYLSIYAFSTDNFKRSDEEVSYLMNLAIKFFKEKINELHQNNIKVIFSGRKEPLSKKVWDAICKVTEITKDNTGGILNICFNYSGQMEIIDAITKAKNLNEKVTEENFHQFLYQDLPDLDLIIRTSGEQRLSNFLLWYSGYAELYFPEINFPDFDEKEFDSALAEYSNRKRRFGGS